MQEVGMHTGGCHQKAQKIKQMQSVDLVTFIAVFVIAQCCQEVWW